MMTQPLNISRGKFYDVELSVQAPLFKTSSVGVNHTGLHRDLVDPCNAAFRPADVSNRKAFVYADWTALPRLHLIPSADIASSRWTVTSAAPITYYRTGAYVNAALKAEYALRKGISISASVRNLFDDKYQLALKVAY